MILKQFLVGKKWQKFMKKFYRSYIFRIKAFEGAGEGVGKYSLSVTCHCVLLMFSSSSELSKARVDVLAGSVGGA